MGKNIQFKENVFIARCQRLIETFLLEANDRGQVSGRNVYAVTVGLGTGAWGNDLLRLGLVPDIHAQGGASYLNALFVNGAIKAMKTLKASGKIPHVAVL